MVFTWIGNLSSSVDQDLAERQLDVIKPNRQSRMLKEGSEYDQFWKLLGIKSEYPSQKIARDQESDSHLFCCTFSKGVLKVREIFNYTQDDMMSEDIFILDCHSCVFIWVGQHVDTKVRAQALNMGEKFLELDILMENVSRETPLYVINEGSEPQYFTRFFTWDSAKSAMRGNSFERRLSVLKDGVKPRRDKPKRRPITSSHTGRSSVPDKSQRRSTSFSPDRVRVRGRSPAFNALAANFENSNARNLSTPPPVARKSFSKSSPDPVKPPQRAASIAAMSASFERPRQTLIPKSIKASPDANKPQSEASKPKSEVNAKESSTPAAKDGKTVAPTIQEDVKEGQPEDEEGLPVFPYDRLRTSSTNPATDIDHSRREVSYCSCSDTYHIFGGVQT
jgi:gelsolin